MDFQPQGKSIKCTNPAARKSSDSTSADGADFCTTVRRKPWSPLSNHGLGWAID